MNVLFVDDDEDVLEGLENRLQVLRKSWRMEFVRGAAAALERVRQHDFDVVVTETRMRDMNGAELLALVRDVRPHALRIVLSGQSQTVRLFSAMTLAVAHQVLAKPCDSKTLEAAVERASSLRSLVVSDVVRAAVARIDRLPAVPALFTRLCSLIDDPGATLEAVAELVSSDTALTARLLQMVNSSFFARREHVTRVHEAVSFLGLDVVRSLVLSAELFHALDDGRQPAGYSLAAFNENAIATARVAKTIAADGATSSDLAPVAFSASILRDVGLLVAASAMPDDVARAFRLMEERSLPLSLAEVEVLGFTHAEIGAYLLAIWGLPSPIVEAVLHHHSPSRAPPAGATLAGTIHIADWLVDGHTGVTLRPQLDESYITSRELGPKLGEWKKRFATNTR